MDADEIAKAHAAGLPHPRHPAPLEDETPTRPPTDAERLWDLHDRGFIDDDEYARSLAELED